MLYHCASDLSSGDNEDEEDALDGTHVGNNMVGIVGVRSIIGFAVEGRRSLPGEVSRRGRE